MDALKHLIKIVLGRRDEKWPFQQLQKQIPEATWEISRKYLCWAEQCVADSAELEAVEKYEIESDPLVKQGYNLSCSVRDNFRDKYSHRQDLRILVHLPSEQVSPAGYSLFSNLAESIGYIGVPVRSLGWDEDTGKVLNEFRPSILITSDHCSYLEKIDWSAVEKYRKSQRLLTGLTASTLEDGNTPVKDRLVWATSHNVDFYYAFRAKEYLDSYHEYNQFRDAGYPLLSVEFGVNPLIYYPVPGMTRDIDYIFMGSGNYPAYLSCFPKIITRHTGFLAGKGWIRSGWVASSCHRYLYSRAKVGLNIHGPFQLNAPCELTERTYILAACGVPQLVDNAKLLPLRFSGGSMFVATSAEEYPRLFEEIIDSPEEAQRRALKAQTEAYAAHTTLHRADGFVSEICSIIDGTH